MAVSSARSAAFDILLQVEQQDAYASELLHADRYANLSAADHALGTELVMGVLRWRSWLDHRIASHSSQRMEKLDAEVLTSLRLAAYQIAFLTRVPSRAAVHESVELVKRARKRSAASFVNAVLRKLANAMSGAEGAFSEDTVPAALKHCSTQHPLSSDAAPASVPQVSENLAHPPWLVERWSKQFGLDLTHRICRFDQTIPRVAIRLRDATAESQVVAEGVRVEPGVLLANARLVLAGDVTKTRAFAEGRIVIQDEASQMVALLVGRGSSILDCCAAPGGKTRLLADRNPQATITAVELHPHRARLLQRLACAPNVRVVATDIRNFTADQKFDRVLADVPCTGTGTLARHPEIKWRLSSADLSDLQSRQLAILRSAMSHVAPGGRLVYSTCSLEPEENSAVVDKALTDTAFRLVSCRTELERLQDEGELAWTELDTLTDGPYLRTIPGVQPCDGFFAAILEKT